MWTSILNIIGSKNKNKKKAVGKCSGYKSFGDLEWGSCCPEIVVLMLRSIVR